MAALRDHFQGEGNVTRRIAEAERLRDALHYKNERSLSFETFLTKCQKMFNIFEKNGEGMEEDAKIRFVFKQIHNKDLQHDIAALKATITTSPPGTITFTTVCNHLSTAVSQLPEYISKNRNISGLTRGTSSIYNSDGEVIVDKWIPNWNDLSKEDKKKVLTARAKAGVKLGRGGKGGDPKGSKNSNMLKKLKKENNKYKRKIKAMKVRIKSEDDSDDEDDAEKESDDDAGDQFGGKNGKMKRKKSSK